MSYMKEHHWPSPAIASHRIADEDELIEFLQARADAAFQDLMEAIQAKEDRQKVPITKEMPS